MPISTKCTHCKAIFRVPDELDGKKVKCQKCASPFTVVKMDETPPKVAAAPEPKKTTKASEPIKTKSVAKNQTAVSAKEPKRPTKVDKKANPDDGLDFSTPSRTPPKKAKSGGGCMLFVMLFFIGGGVLGCIGCVGGITGWQMGWFGGDNVVVVDDKKIVDKLVVIKDFKDLKDNPFKDLGKDNPFKDLAKDNPFKDIAKDDPFKDMIKIDGAKDLFKDKDKTLDDKKDAFKDKDKVDLAKDLFKDKDAFKDLPNIDEKKDPFDGKKPPKVKPTGTPIVFNKNGLYQSDNTLDDNDPISQVGKKYKLYSGLFQAGQNYLIEMNSNQIDSYLIVLNSKAMPVVENDDGGGNLNAKVVFSPATTGMYRIQATSFRRDDRGAFSLTVRHMELAAKGNGKDPPDKIDNGDISHRTLSFKNPTKLIGDMVWARDGKSFFLMNTDGQIARFDAATGDILKQHDFARKCNNLAMSGEGLLISARDAQEVWLVDPDDLGSVLRRIPVSALTRVTAGVDSSVAIAGSGGGFGKTGLNVLDLKKGTAVEFYKGFAINHLIASPDGKYVFADEFEHLKRYRLTEMALKFEEQSYRLGSASSICVSPCSTYVAMPSGGGNGRNHPDHPQVDNGYSTFVYPAWNLKRPALTVGSGAYPRALGFDTKLGYVIAQNTDNPLLLFSFGGIGRGGTQIPGFGRGTGGDVYEFAVSPTGGEVLLRSDAKVIQVTLKLKGEPIAKLDPPPDPKIEPKVDPKVDPKKDPPITKDPPKLVQSIEAKDVSYKVIPFKTDGPVKHPVWADDGKSFYVALMNGNLLRINAETQKIEKSHALNKRLDLEASLSMSAEGLVLASPNERQILIIDPDDLSVIKKKINADFARFTVGRDSKYGIAAMNTAKASVRFVDLEKPELSAPILFKLATHSMRMSADGSFVFFTDAGKIIRYRADGQRLAFEEQSATYVFAPGSVHLSPDGSMVSLAGDPAAPPADNPVRGLRIMQSDSVKKPTLVIPKFDTPRAVGLDTRAGWYFIADTKKPLTIFNLSGVKQVEVPMPEVDLKDVLEIHPSPIGQSAIFKTRTQVVQVKLNLPTLEPIARVEQPMPDPKIGPEPKKIVIPGGINVVFGADGSYRSDNFLTDIDGKNRDGKKYKPYVVRLEEGMTYQIDMSSPMGNFDSYLYLADDANKVVAQDDDNGGFPNARIVHTAGKTGFYRIEATTLGGGSNGRFTLTVRRINKN